jgi:hypothetical protein
MGLETAAFLSEGADAETTRCWARLAWPQTSQPEDLRDDVQDGRAGCQDVQEIELGIIIDL